MELDDDVKANGVPNEVIPTEENLQEDQHETQNATMIAKPKEVNNDKSATSDPLINESVSEITHKSEENWTKPPISKIKRNVKFPEENEIACFKDAPDPWKNDNGDWNTEELIGRYKKACEGAGLKPSNKIVQQLHGIENTGERYEIISMKGEKLDLKQCDCLEEIFKRVQFKTVDLEATHLDDDTAAAMFDMIEYYESACKVNMSFNKNISTRGWQACSRLIRRTPCLNFLDARNCDLNERMVPILGRALKMGAHVRTLHLENTYLSGRSLVILVVALKNNETLKELFLADNRLVPSDGIQLGSLLKNNFVLELLDLRNNHLQDVGVGHICGGLFEQSKGSGLQTLVLWNNQLSYLGMADIGKALTSNDSLETINIGHNQVTNEGIHLMKDGLLKSKSLLRLGLQGTKITCEGAVALAEVIADSPRLLRLDLRENEIKTAGLMALSLSLKVNESVTRLDLDRETKKESGVKDYAEQQLRLRDDIKSYLERNHSKTKLKTEEERLKLEISIKENARTSRSNSFVESLDIDDNSKYIPSMDRVKRPRLLVMGNHENAQQSLDSPMSDASIMITSKPPDIANVISPLLEAKPMSTPPGELLLSPQFCNTVKAKKIFTVSRVESASSVVKSMPSQVPASVHNLPSLSVSASSLVSSPAGLPSSVYSIPNLPLITSPCVSNIAVDSLIKQIVTETFVNEALGTSLNSIRDNSANEILQSSSHVENGQNETIGNSTDTTLLLHNNESEKNANNMELGNDFSSENSKWDKNNGSVVESRNSDKNNQSSVASVLSESSSKETFCEKCAIPTSKQETQVSNMQKSPLTTTENNTPPGDYKPDVNVNVGNTKTRETEGDSGVGSYENEHWTKVEACEGNEESPLSDSKCSNPDFYSNLSLNGLTLELASALENIDSVETREQSKEECPFLEPDDFEKELDQMIAEAKAETPLHLSESGN